MEIPCNPSLFKFILDTFLNEESVKRSSNEEEFLKEKLERLHLIFDSLLNAQNRLYSGLQQEIKTDELSTSYHNVTKVFSMTSQAGLSSRFKHATLRLQQQADPDSCYYKTFLRKYSFDYQPVDGIKMPVSIQDCHLIFCLDNLVRLTFHRDPDRGEFKRLSV